MPNDGKRLVGEAGRMGRLLGIVTGAFSRRANASAITLRLCSLEPGFGSSLST